MAKLTQKQIDVLAHVAACANGAHVRSMFFTVGRSNGKAQAVVALDTKKLIVRDAQNPLIYHITDEGRAALKTKDTQP